MTDLPNFWTQHTPIFSILLPAFTAFALVLLGNPGAGSLITDWRQPWRRGISHLSGILGLIIAVSYLINSSQGQISVYTLSEWAAPFGIVLVLDQLSAMMLVLTYALALPVVWYASKEWDLRGRYFHAMVHFLLMGLTGAFLTGDLFNLFVFFEILLMASYVLLLHGQGKARFQLGIHYVTINLLASALFLIGLGMIYGSVGSLNMADVARLLPTLAEDQHKLAVAGGLMLFVVFGIKAAMLPVGFWLPKTYAVATTPVAALFTIMTKVGIYAILRINGTVFDHFKIAPLMKQNKLVSIVYFIIALMMAGLPPFSGFFGKIFILQASANSDYQMIIILTILLVSFLSILAFTRVGFILFWRSSRPEDDLDSEEFHKYEALPSKAPARNDRVIYILLASLTAYVVFAGPIYQYNYQTAEQIKKNSVYEAALLKPDAEGQFISVQPFDPKYLPETKYGGEVIDPNAHLIPYVISEATLKGEHISEFKQRQIDQQHIEQTEYDDNQLKPAEGP